MAKKTRNKAAAKVAKTAKALTRKKGAKKKTAKKKTAVAKKPRKAAVSKKSKPVAAKKPVPENIVTPPSKSFPEKVAGAFSTVVDILTDAERLHHKLDPGVSREPE